MRTRNRRRINVRLASASLFAVLALAACGPSEPPIDGGAPALRRLSESEYRQSIADLFGPDIRVAGHFEAERRNDGLLALGAAQGTITRAGLDGYEAMARSIAAQVLAPAKEGESRPDPVGCAPAAADAAGAECARTFLARIGRLAFRRPLSEAELTARVAAAGDAARLRGSFRAGLGDALAGLLASPQFLFRIERPAANGREIDAYSKAARLSFLLWDAAPDEALLQAAAGGRLDDRKGRAEEVERLLASPRLEAGVRAFFTDFLGLDAARALDKDPVIYPSFNQTLADDAVEQTLRTVVHHLVTRQGDYRDLFTTRATFMNRVLGQVYAVPVRQRSGWQPFTFAGDDPRAGLLTQIAFTGLHSHPGRSSPTLRGKAIRELLLCQPVPDPPGNVNFALVQDTANPMYRTARQRLTAHRSDPTCAGCHQVIDPIGLALENFDGLGEFRQDENGTAIDASGDLDGFAFRDPVGLGQAMHDNPATTSCLVQSTWRYAVGRKGGAGEADFVRYLERRFAGDGHRLTGLLRTIANSDAFYRIALQTEEAAR